MSVRFLSEEYMAAATAALAERSELETGDLQLTVQFRVTDPPGGDEPIHYHLRFSGGEVVMAPGEAEDPDVRITTGYDTAAGLAREEIRDQIAFLTGKLKVAGNMARLMANLSTFMEVRRTLRDLDVEF
jgi:putative sterol carrier protein